MRLPSHLEERINDRILTGRYRSPEEVVTRALDLLEEEELDAAEVRAAVQKGLGELDRGESIPAEEVFRELRERHRVRFADEA